MKKNIKILGIIILIIAPIIGGVYLYLTDFGREPSNPRIEIPITYNIGWWTNQNKLTIENLDIEIIESKLNLFNSKSLISYRINGEIKFEGNWKPSIKEIHISERINRDTTQTYNRIIELTPIVKVKNDENVNGGVEKFDFTNEHIITSGNWGMNRIKFVCGAKEIEIELRQTK